MNGVISLFVSFIMAFGAGLIGSFYTAPAIDSWYATLIKSDLNPPNWIFGPVWTILYACMAIAAWRVYVRRGSRESYGALGVYGAHLGLNALWSITFFGWQRPGVALGIMVALWLSIVLITILFYRTDRFAGALFLPYLSWVSFAAYLNAGIVLLN